MDDKVFFVKKKEKLRLIREIRVRKTLVLVLEKAVFAELKLLDALYRQ